jgi:uncharacterized protein
MTHQDVLAIDAVCNLLTPEVAAARPPWSLAFMQSTFHHDASIHDGIPLTKFVDQMDEAGIEHALLIAVKAGPEYDPLSLRLPYQRIVEAVEAYPDRFSGLVGIDPIEGMKGVRELENLVTNYGFVGAHLYPHWFGLPPDSARYYPFYAKCCELDVPIQMQAGHCLRYSPDRPLVNVGRPEAIDIVACHLPELKLVAIHMGWPWVEEMIAVTFKHPNVYIGGDAYAPAYWPANFVHYINSWGKQKVIYGTDFPALTFARTRKEIDDLDLRPDSKRMLLRTNAVKLYRLNDRLRSSSTSAS